jgi:hypothetical protein
METQTNYSDKLSPEVNAAVRKFWAALEEFESVLNAETAKGKDSCDRENGQLSVIVYIDALASQDDKRVQSGFVHGNERVVRSACLSMVRTGTFGNAE